LFQNKISVEDFELIELRNTESKSLLPSNQTHLNFRLTDEHFTKAGSKTQFKQNIAAIKLLHELEEAHTLATLEQQNILATYAGWGGLSQAFDPHNTNWQREYTELKVLLSLEEYKAANESVLTAFYTPKNIIDGTYSALKHLGFTGGTILEPAMVKQARIPKTTICFASNYSFANVVLATKKPSISHSSILKFMQALGILRKKIIDISTQNSCYFSLVLVYKSY